MTDVHKVFKTLVAVDSGVRICDTIFYEDKFWLVPAWFLSPDGQWRVPARIICMDGLMYQKCVVVKTGADFLLNDPIPKSLFEPGQPPAGLPFVYVDRPKIRFPILH